MKSAAGDAPLTAETQVCDRCNRPLTASDRVVAGDRVFCRACYEALSEEVRHAVREQSSDIPYAMATLGAVLGGAAGALVWWGFTVLTHIGFGLIAVAIGYLVGWGAVKFAGGKRSAGMQGLCVIVALASFAAATYLVNMTFINQQLAARGDAFRIGVPPASFDLFVKVVSGNFGIMDVVFLGIAVYQAWSIPRPLSLPGSPQSPKT